MGALHQDLRYASRLMVRNPVFTAVIILSIALGIGANTLIFSVVHAVLLHSLPYNDPDRLVMIWFTSPKLPDQNDAATVGNYLALRCRRTWRSVNARASRSARTCSMRSTTPTSMRCRPPLTARTSAGSRQQRVR